MFPKYLTDLRINWSNDINFSNFEYLSAIVYKQCIIRFLSLCNSLGYTLAACVYIEIQFLIPRWQIH